MNFLGIFCLTILLSAIVEPSWIPTDTSGVPRDPGQNVWSAANVHFQNDSSTVLSIVPANSTKYTCSEVSYDSSVSYGTFSLSVEIATSGLFRGFHSQLDPSSPPFSLFPLNSRSELPFHIWALEWLHDRGIDRYQATPAQDEHLVLDGAVQLLLDEIIPQPCETRHHLEA